jgi:hypothetical protein
MSHMAARSSDREAIEAEIDRIGSLGLAELRSLWRATFRSPPPSAFNRDLLVHSLSWHLQEEAFGGIDPGTRKLLADLGRGAKPGVTRRLKAGTVLVRECQGERHIVTVVSGGYLWRETTYASLSTIARAITGTAWSGPRFFGLRCSKAEEQSVPARGKSAKPAAPHRRQTHSSRSTGEP